MNLKICLLLIICFNCLCAYAQSSQQIEADLIKSFKKIDHYYNLEEGDTTTRNAEALESANFDSEKKLENYLKRYQALMTYPFHELRHYVGMVTSNDAALRIFEWNTHMGGTQQDYVNLFQYKTKQGSGVLTDDNNDPNIKTPIYDTIYTFKGNGKVYYVALYEATMALNRNLAGVRVFTIENDTLNRSVKLFKTTTGLHNRIEYNYSNNMDDVTNSILYDSKTATIGIPVILENGVSNTNYITYKFTGKYFEKVKP